MIEEWWGGRACERRRSGGLAVDLGALEGAVRANFCVFDCHF